MYSISCSKKSLCQFKKSLFFTLAALLLSSWVSAKDAPVSGPTYIPLAPPLVVNYGDTGPLKYLKAEISLRVDDAETVNAVRHHMPMIRNNLVMLFSRQTEEDIKSQEGKERLRITALEEINALITVEEGKSAVADLLFNNLVVQR
jgi:flagellar FliL protein